MRIRDMGGLSDAESPTDSAELWIFEIGALLRKLWLKNVGILVSSNGSLMEGDHPGQTMQTNCQWNNQQTSKTQNNQW